MTAIPPPDLHGNYRFSDGACICRANHWTQQRPIYRAWWSDKTPLRGDDEGNEAVSFFMSAESAAQALAEGGEGPAAHAKAAVGTERHTP